MANESKTIIGLPENTESNDLDQILFGSSGTALLKRISFSNICKSIFGKIISNADMLPGLDTYSTPADGDKMVISNDNGQTKRLTLSALYTYISSKMLSTKKYEMSVPEYFTGTTVDAAVTMNPNTYVTVARITLEPGTYIIKGSTNVNGSQTSGRDTVNLYDKTSNVSRGTEHFTHTLNNVFTENIMHMFSLNETSEIELRVQSTVQRVVNPGYIIAIGWKK